ncbi:MAG: SDR family NAD(P)-dependent oxidoreductase [Promethearchaeota archaeon]
MSEEKLFSGLNVVVTGSGRGIGKTLALAFAREGANVGLTARTAGEIEATRDEIRAAGGNAVSVTCDVSDWNQVQRLAGEMGEKLGNAHVLVNNAGTNRFGSIAKMDPERFDTIMKVNAYGTFYCTKAFLPQLIENGGGKVVNTSSVAALEGFPSMSVYCMSKAAVNRFTESAGSEFARFNVQINAVMPTYIETPLLMSGLKEEDKAKFDIKKPERLIPYYRFFASRKLSGNLTGQVVNLEHFWVVEDLVKSASGDQRKWKGFRELAKEKLNPHQFESVRKNRKLVAYLLKEL